MSEAVKRITSYKLPFKKLTLNQFGAALLGIMLTSACRSNDILNILTSLFSIAFFMIINYSSMWDIGAKDRVRVDGKRADEDLWYGLKASLIANIPNFALAFLCVVCKFLSIAGNNSNSFFAVCDKISWFCNIVVRFWEAMYLGLIVSVFPDAGTSLSGMQPAMYMMFYFVIILPSLVVCTLAYRAGYNNFRIVPEKKTNGEQ